MLSRTIPWLMALPLFWSACSHRAEPHGGFDVKESDSDSQGAPVDVLDVNEDDAPLPTVDASDLMDAAWPDVPDTPTEDIWELTSEDSEDVPDIVVAPSPVLGEAVHGGVELVVTRQSNGNGGLNESGRISAKLLLEPTDTYISSTRPASIFAAVTQEADGCALLTFEPGQCEPACSWSEVCDQSNTCQEWPAPASAGVISVSGLEIAGGESLEMTPYPPNFYYFSDTLPATFIGPESELELSAPGADLPAFEYTIGGVAPLALDWDIEQPLPLPDAGATLTWEAGDDPAAMVRVSVVAPSYCHGCPYRAQLVCEGPDSGSLTLPSGLVELLPEIPAHDMCFGYDCDKSSIERFTRLRTPYGDGQIEIVASSRVHFFFERTTE